MPRRSNLLIALVVGLVVAVPVAFALLGGSDDTPEPPKHSGPPGQPAGGRVEVPAAGDDAPPGRARDTAEQTEKGGRGPGGGRGRGGGPPHSPVFEEQMKGIAYPTRITRSGRPLATIAERVLGRQVSPGQRTVFAADCRGGRCALRYRSTARGGGAVDRDQTSLVRALFRRRGVQRLSLYVHGPITGRNKDERTALSVTRCTRPSTLTARAIGRACSTRTTGGKAKGQVKRDQLDPGAASTGEVAPDSARGGSSKPGGAEPAPENVPGTSAAERRARERRQSRRQARERREDG